MSRAQEPKTPEAVKRAEARLAENPDDPEANLTLGKHLCFVREEWDRGLRHLAKGSDEFFKALAEKDVSRKDPLSIAEGWWKASVEVEAHLLTGAAATAKVKLKEEAKHLYPRMVGRAFHWYGEAWPRLADVDKARLRPRLRAALLSDRVPDVRGVRPPKGWTSCDEGQKAAGVTTKAARSGRSSWQVVCGHAAGELYISLRADVPAKPGAKYAFTAWVLSDGNADGSKFSIQIHGPGKMLAAHEPAIAPDTPVWKKLEAGFVGPEGAEKIQVLLAVVGKKGTIFVDDVSLKAGGEELLKNGGFEER